jgi:hypothetical protein
MVCILAKGSGDCQITRIPWPSPSSHFAEPSEHYRIRIAVAPEGLGRQHGRMTAWLDENCGADGWAMSPSGMQGVPNDAVSIYFPNPALAAACVARWCIGYYKVETAEGAFQVREGGSGAAGRGRTA